MKYCSPAFDKNKQPITDVLLSILPDSGCVLEIGSGSGQHICWFAEQFPTLQWQPSDLAENLPSIEAWSESENLPNVLPGKEINLLEPASGDESYDALICINTIHIVALTGVKNLFLNSAKRLNPGGLLFIYGPLRYTNQPLEPSNQNFDGWLKQRNPSSGIRHFSQVNDWAAQAGLRLQEDIKMPSNNRCVWWQLPV
ncbi:MAG: cyclopropane fatty-acyl-phospholipid synthase-like methyltransferase [Parasphingorhabdus sp.]|jgi:cyclopropane fatty-acyl-phospholipid synthase-like methyltransferase